MVVIFVDFRALLGILRLPSSVKAPIQHSAYKHAAGTKNVVREYFYLDFSLPAMKYIGIDF